MVKQLEQFARDLVRALYDTTEGRPQQWRMVELVMPGDQAQVVRYAVERGWMLADGDSISLTDEGRRLVA